MTQAQNVSHSWEEETAEAKARWFQSLSLTERMNMFCWFTDMILSANPRIMEQKDAKSIAGRVLVLTKTQSQVRNYRGVAAILHGVPRTTFDLDILIEATLDNAQRLLTALFDAGLGTAEMTTAEELLKHEITIFRDKVRIDVQTATPGIEFEAAWQKKEVMKYRKQEFYVVSLEDLIASKRAAGRDKDLEDIRLLELKE